MANKNNTREGIHSGLSQSKSDEKWSDMLNFRNSDNRTFAVPRRLGLLQEDAGLHTVIHGVGDVNYAIGSKKSYMFRSHDSTVFAKLWRARLERLTSTEDQSENLKIRGSYTGSVPRNIRLTVVKGQLVPDYDWPVAPVPVVETPYVPMLNCNANFGNYYLYLTVAHNGLPVSAAEITIYQGTQLIGEYTSNANGLFSLFLPKNFYTVIVKHPDYVKEVFQDFTILDQDVYLTVDTIKEDATNFIGLTITSRYSNTEGPVPGGHICDSAVFKLLGNGVEIGIVNLNNASDGGDREVIYTLTPEQAQEIANAGSGTSLDLSLVCDPTHPDFDPYGLGNGSCHTNLVWVIVQDAEANELYNGAPVGYFLTIEF